MGPWVNVSESWYNCNVLQEHVLHKWLVYMARGPDPFAYVSAFLGGGFTAAGCGLRLAAQFWQRMRHDCDE
jgi:hypothetical protein